MLNVIPILNRMVIRTSSVVFAVADAASYVNCSPDPIKASKRLFKELLEVDVDISDAVYGRIAAKALVDQLVRKQGIIADLPKADIGVEREINDERCIIAAVALAYADTFVADPSNSYLWSAREESADEEPIDVVKGLDCKVNVNADGKIRKGGKQILAAELFSKYITNAEVPMTNKEFVELLVKELGMSKAGATTYGYNLRKAVK